MPDNLTTPRQLNQIHWEAGITDGDIRPGFMAKLLNVEMDEKGRIRCRDGVVSHDIHIPTINPSKFIHINGDPSALYNNGWNIFLTINTAYIYPYGYDMTNEDKAELPLPFDIDIDSIEVVIIGTNLIISSLAIDGTPNDVISIVWITDEGKFSPPEYVVDGDDVYPELPGNKGWGIHEFDAVPEIHSYICPSVISHKKENNNYKYQF